MAYGKNRLATALGLDSSEQSPADESDEDSADEKSGADYDKAELAAAEDVQEAFEGKDPARLRDSLKRFIEICQG